MAQPLDSEGIATFHTRAEQWECDINAHWNTRFYMRSFQAASVMVASLGAAELLLDTSTPQWHMRFHKELFAGAPVEVRSSRIASGPHAGATLHRLSSLGQLCATAIERPGLGHALPAASAEAMVQARPLGLVDAPCEPWVEDAGQDFRTEVGYVRPLDLNQGGRPYLDDVMARCSHASTLQLTRLGFTPDFIRLRRVNRMLVEQRATFLGPCVAGDCLTILSRLKAVQGRTFSTAHYLHTRAGTPVATLELCLIAVDLDARRATGLPAFITAPAPDRPAVAL